MSVNMTKNQIQAYDKEVKHAYQSVGANLNQYCRPKLGITGYRVRFKRYGGGSANPHLSNTDVVPLNLDQDHVWVPLSDWIAMDRVARFDEQRIDHDEVSECGTELGYAMKRRDDQMVIDALHSAPTTGKVEKTIGGVGFNTTKMRAARRTLDRRSVMGKRHLLVHTDQLNDIIALEEVNSKDYNVVQALAQGELNRYLGFDIMAIGDYEDDTYAGATHSRADGLPFDRANGTHSCFAWVKSAVAYTTGKVDNATVEWDMRARADQCTYSKTMGSGYIDARGIIQIDAAGGEDGDYTGMQGNTLFGNAPQYLQANGAFA